ncbi:unnamed protein product [Owenia fusiformis]|uniref:BAR domain-containing protein n=1 Tax=Owenia fusiformis TaxID=6347 RepID=A0A8S4NNA1_OWEFU|nr:unnamed protein product [Owenia fusiformis]
MSWNPFRRSKIEKRAISTTEEREFEREVKRIQQLEENSKKLYKELKKYETALDVASRSECSLTLHLCESINLMDTSQSMSQQPLGLLKSTVWHLDPEAMTKVESRVSQDVLKVKFKPDESNKGIRNYADEWNRASQRLENQQKVLTFNCHKGVSEPIKKYIGHFPQVYSAIKKREAALHEYNKSQAKVDKYQDKDRTGANVVKLDTYKKGLVRSKDEYERNHKHTMRVMPSMYDYREDYFKPCLAVLVNSQANYYTESLKIYSEMANETGDISNSEQIHHRTQDTLKQIKALTIVADD